jgi:hypothetical protein
MDFLEEYNEMHTINAKVAVTYKFLDLFKVSLKEDKGLYWGKQAVDKNLTDEELLAFKNYLKAKKTEVRKDVKVQDCGKIIWFLYQKILEHGAFDLNVRREIRSYMDLCEYILL